MSSLTTLILGQNLCRRAALQTFRAHSVVDGQRRYYSAWVRNGFATQRILTARRDSDTRQQLARRPWSSSRSKSTSTSPGAGASSTPDTESVATSESSAYRGPLTQTFRRLKIFSLASLGLTFTMTPFLFIVESSLPTSARIFLTATAVSTSGISTVLVGWCGAPYVVNLRRLKAQGDSGEDGIDGALEMTTLTLTLKKLTTRVYDPDFLVSTNRPFAKWELPLAIQLPPPGEDSIAAGKAGSPNQEETVAETFNDKGEIVGRWIVTWGEGGSGSCRGTGKVVR
ncbi:hypothetical protein JVU11DRAFT_7494 [Chiua virens]|nr:hypothetical protein JVU11DRAFT_7494 [Chiua virens]